MGYVVFTLIGLVPGVQNYQFRSRIPLYNVKGKLGKPFPVHYLVKEHIVAHICKHSFGLSPSHYSKDTACQI